MNFLFNINVCRVCMQNEQSNNLLNDKELLDKFTFTTRLTISEKDNLPKVICSNCTLRLKVAHKFIHTAHESEINLKKFLAKINNEFKEVTQSSKNDKVKDNSQPCSEQNLTEDEMLTLIGEDDETESSNISSSKNSNENETANTKRKPSPIKESLCKSFKREREHKAEAIENDDLQPKQLFQQSSKSETRRRCKAETSYSLSEDILLLHSENNINLIETEEQREMEKSQMTKTVNRQRENIQKEEIVEDQDQDLLEDRDEEEHEDIINNDIHDILEDPDQDHKEDFVMETLEDNEREKDFKTHNTNMLNINEDASETPELTELHLEENQLHQSLSGNPSDIENIGQHDGYLREYETMLNSQVNELQYPTDYIEENSVEESSLKDDEEEIYAIDSEENIVQFDDPMTVSIQSDTNGRDQKDKNLTKHSMRKDVQTKFHRFYCNQCNRDFSTKTNLNRHMQSHEGNKPHVCAECSKSFSQKSTLKQHMYTHTGERPYVCDVCDRGFTQCKSLIFHMRRHTGEKPFLCEYCLIMFRQKDALRIHILKYHVIIEQLDNGKELYTCIICQKKFNTKADFKIHMKIHTATTTTETETNDFVADDETSANITTHSSSHGPPLPTTFFQDESLDVAVMNISASSASEPRRAKKFQCRKCFKCFALKKSFVRHMSIHYMNTEEDITECSDCDLQFSNADEYQEHLSERHQFACSACPHLIFKTIQELKMHMFKHEVDHQEQVQDELI